MSRYAQEGKVWVEAAGLMRLPTLPYRRQTPPNILDPRRHHIPRGLLMEAAPHNEKESENNRERQGKNNTMWIKDTSRCRCQAGTPRQPGLGGSSERRLRTC